MIIESKKLSKTNIYIAKIRYKINDNNLERILKTICRGIVMRKRLFIPIEKT